jgi:PPE-SVP subfamily C-terminal region
LLPKPSLPPAGQAATVAQNVAAVPAATTTGPLGLPVSTTVPTTFVQFLETLIQNTIAQYPSGGWGLGLVPGNLNSMRQILQAYFAVGLGNFGYGIGQQVITPAQATALFNPGALTPKLGLGGLGAGLGGGTAGVSGAPYTASSVSASLGQASTLGRLSVPAGWQGATPAEMEEAQLASAARPVAPQSNAMLNGVPMAGNAGLGRRGGGYVVKYGVKHAVMPRPPAGG